MAKFKNIRIRKKGGGSRLQRVQVLKSGKYKFVKNTNVKRASTRARTARKTSRSRTLTKRRKTSTRTRRASTRSPSSRKRGRKVAKGSTKNKMLLFQGLGAGVSGAVSGTVKNTLGINVADEYASLGIGYLLDKSMSGVGKFVGQGMMVAGIAGVTSSLTSGLLGGLGVGSTSASTATGVQVQV